jgi:OOP family OmpA-OmpF porin
VAVLALSLSRPALAVEERAWVSLETGVSLYDTEQALRDAPVFGLRAAGFLNRWVGVEGMYGHSSPRQEPSSLGNATVTHLGGGLILTPQRYGWTLPYLYGGIGSIKVDRDLSGAKSSGACHLGVGAVFRAGERFGIRLDARDVSYKEEGGPGLPGRVNEFQISSGITAFWLGRPRDTDADGVPNKNDKCPDTPKGAVVDRAGCPVDTDGDKIYDGLDKCPGTPPGAIVDASGCPLDQDADGVFDGIDKCPDTPKGVLVDATGCSLDTDGDGVPDGPDQCPGTPKGAIVNAAGCPSDQDQDGVPDGVDTCPFTPPHTAVNAGGCPIELSEHERDLMDDWVIRLTDVEFVPDSVGLTPEGMARVMEVGSVLAQWPMLKFEVGVHSDDTGEVARRQPLSHLRARGILQQIFAQYPSLNPKNYFYTGYGDTQPIASNKTAQGRAKNRRVEFRLINMDALTKERERRGELGTTPVSPQGMAPPGSTEPQGAPAVPGAPAAESTPAPSRAPAAAAASGAGAPVSAPNPAEKIPPAPTPPDSIPPAPSPPDSIPKPTPPPAK